MSIPILRRIKTLRNTFTKYNYEGRLEDEKDINIYGKHEGCSCCPTAGLLFPNIILKRLENQESTLLSDLHVVWQLYPVRIEDFPT